MTKAAPPCKQVFTNLTTCECEDCITNILDEREESAKRYSAKHPNAKSNHEHTGLYSRFCLECNPDLPKQTDVVEEMCEDSHNCFCKGKLQGDRAKHSEKGCSELTALGEYLLGVDNAKPEREFYTKQEIRKLFMEMAALVRALGRVVLKKKNKKAFTDSVDEFYLRFLS